MAKINFLMSEIEKIYNNDWKTKGILPHNKVKLQDKILNNELPYFFILLKQQTTNGLN
jgi:hypothetical protein